MINYHVRFSCPASSWQPDIDTNPGIRKWWLCEDRVGEMVIVSGLVVAAGIESALVVLRSTWPDATVILIEEL